MLHTRLVTLRVAERLTERKAISDAFGKEKERTSELLKQL